VIHSSVGAEPWIARTGRAMTMERWDRKRWGLFVLWGRAFSALKPQLPDGTSPLMGEVGRGCCEPRYRGFHPPTLISPRKSLRPGARKRYPAGEGSDRAEGIVAISGFGRMIVFTPSSPGLSG
jgi:hypothetical protein